MYRISRKITASKVIYILKFTENENFKINCNAIHVAKSFHIKIQNLTFSRYTIGNKFLTCETVCFFGKRSKRNFE